MREAVVVREGACVVASPGLHYRPWVGWEKVGGGFAVSPPLVSPKPSSPSLNQLHHYTQPISSHYHHHLTNPCAGSKAPDQSQAEFHTT
ncbi:hypothetical protein Pcinc_026277 [Petrolisthes cinctipes]|uniref:Uncharacterized protein n=1 Tax=Petrolisthes cinctipes TaxID=88211 RepID=A0AAE1F8T5_PETCI|nr:hypothetical protein Pcinc_026277 [Petrolisthes cinctipes]